MLHLQLFRGDPLNPAMIAEGIFFKNQVAPFDIQSITLQHELFALSRQQTGVMRGRHHGDGGHNDANEQAEWQFPKTQKIVTDHARQRMALVAS